MGVGPVDSHRSRHRRPAGAAALAHRVFRRNATLRGRRATATRAVRGRPPRRSRALDGAAADGEHATGGEPAVLTPGCTYWESPASFTTRPPPSSVTASWWRR